MDIYKQYKPDELQLLSATETSIRTRQGQHYRRDVACLEQECYYTPARGRFKSSGHSLVAVKTILPIQTPINKKSNKIYKINKKVLFKLNICTSYFYLVTRSNDSAHSCATMAAWTLTPIDLSLIHI